MLFNLFLFFCFFFPLSHTHIVVANIGIGLFLFQSGCGTTAVTESNNMLWLYLAWVVFFLTIQSLLFVTFSCKACRTTGEGSNKKALGLFGNKLSLSLTLHFSSDHIFQPELSLPPLPSSTSSTGKRLPMKKNCSISQWRMSPRHFRPF